MALLMVRWDMTRHMSIHSMEERSPNTGAVLCVFFVSKGKRSPNTGASRSARRRFLPMTTRLSRRSPPPHYLEILPAIAASAAPGFETPPPVVATSSPVKGKALMEETLDKVKELKGRIKMLEAGALDKVKELEGRIKMLEAGTLNKVKELEGRIKMLEDEKYEILEGRNEMHQLKSTATKWTSETLVIAFVEAIEKADQYIDFKKYLKRDGYIEAESDPNYIFDTLVQSPIRKELFEKIDDGIIRIAINAHICIAKLVQEIQSQYKYQIYLTRCKFIKPNSKFKDDINAIGKYDEFPGLSSDDMERELQIYKRFIIFSPSEEAMVRYTEKIERKFSSSLSDLKQLKDMYEATYVIYDIVFRTRQAQYTMDQDPELELEKLTKLCPRLYFDLVAELKKMLNPDLEQSGKDLSSLERTVMVFRVPPHASEVDVTKAFSCCGDIESVEMESGYQCQIANVTYKNADGAERANRLQRTKVCDVDVKISASRYSRLEDCEAWDKEMEAARKPELSTEEVERLLKRMRKKALKKYRKLAKLYGKYVKAERNDGVVEDVCSKPSEGTKKKAQKHRKRRGRKVDVRTPLQDDVVA